MHSEWIEIIYSSAHRSHRHQRRTGTGVVGVSDLRDVLAQSLQVVDDQLLENVVVDHRLHDSSFNFAEKLAGVAFVLLRNQDEAVVVWVVEFWGWN